MKSHFIAKKDYLVEKLGPLDLYFQPREEDGSLNYQFNFTKLWGIPLPSFLSPKIYAKEFESDGKYNFEVKVHMFCIGLVLAYGGTMQLIDGR